MSRYLRLAAIAWGGFHLTLAIMSSAKIPVWDYMGKGPLAAITVVYAYMSGVGNHYGFFAPGVMSHMRVDYACMKNEREVASGTLKTANTETTFRWHNIIENFWLSQEKDEVRRSQAASLAGKVWSRYPEADGVRLSVKAYVLPSMAEYGMGMRPSWEAHYSVSFRKGSRGTP